MTDTNAAKVTEELVHVHGLPAKLVDDTIKVEAIAARCAPSAIAHLPAMTQAVVLADGMRQLRNAMTKELVEFAFMPNQGSKLGFRTDKDKEGGYPWDVVRDCAIEALLRGLQPIGNEFNIIGGNCYTTLEAYERKLRQVPGLTDFQPEPGVPVLKDGGALVPYTATWRLGGKPDSLECIHRTDKDGVVSDTRIPVRVNSGQIVDAILGKAKRKFLARVYERVTGVRLPGGDSDVEVIDTVGEAVKEDARAQGTDAATDDLISKHKAKVDAKKNGTKTASANADPAAGSDGHPEPGANG